MAEWTNKLRQYYGYDVREPYPSEHEYFRVNPNVSGMATEDNRITFNPFSQGINQQAVGENEAARLWMRTHYLNPQFDVTPEQQEYFSGTPYESNPIATRQTLLGRMISGDPSAGTTTPEQQDWVDWLLRQLRNR